MIKIISITLSLLLLPFAYAGTFKDINRGDNHPASKQEMQDIERQEEQQISDDGQLGTFQIQTEEDSIKTRAAEKKRKQQEADQ